jgi:hypothetical protein
MICRYKIHDQETNEVLIAVGDNIQFFESMGYTEVGEVERAYDGRYFVAGHAPMMPQEEVVTQVRAERDRRLTETDWYMMPDYPADPETLEVVKNYRKALRDITLQSGFPRDVEWPVMPKVFSGNTEGTPSIGLAKVGIP